MANESKRITIFDLPDAQSVKADFTYNFFQPDERTNGSGDKRAQGVIVKDDKGNPVGSLWRPPQNTSRTTGNLNTEIPRYVKVSIAPPQKVAFGTLSAGLKAATDKGLVTERDFGEGLENLMTEDSITNPGFVAVSESDQSARNRIGKKASLLSDALGIDFSSSTQSNDIAKIVGFEADVVKEVISPYNSPETLRVNFKPDKEPTSLFDLAEQMRGYYQANLLFLDQMQNSGDDPSPLGKAQTKSIVSKGAKQFRAVSTGQKNESDLLPNLTPYDFEDIGDAKTQNGVEGMCQVGYVLYRHQTTPTGAIIKSSRKLLLGSDSTEFLDTEIVYGSRYGYSASAVFRVDAVVDVKDPQENGFRKQRVKMLIESRPTQVVFVETEEFNPPNPPDGLFYRFNYSKDRGLILTWQMPVGRSRDTKYFQVFKRKSIQEPFKCIAEIDFDDSNLRTLRPETVRQDLVIRSDGPLPYFEDKSFNRDSGRAIYAVCAVDAHGITSGYSAQTQVGFDKMRNALTLKNISRPGAPKQYPNFFVDPDLDDNIAVDSFTQDAIFDSGRTRMYVYFTPDAKSVKFGNDVQKGFVTDAEGVYKALVINTDLQKSTTVEIKIANNEVA